MALTSLNDAQKQQLLAVAKQAIEHGLATGRPLPINLADYPSELQERRATFVTLHKNRQLRGCIGKLEARKPLVVDIAENAYSAAFHDPRFLPLERAELTDLNIHLSILSPAEPMTFSSEQDLLKQLKPGVDGLILTAGHRRGTFLPSVWEQLPEPGQFLRHLKQKSGLPADYWSDQVKVYRYWAESVC